MVNVSVGPVEHKSPSFLGQLLDSSLAGGRAQVVLRWDSRRLEVSTKDSTSVNWTLFLRDCVFEVGGNHNSILWIRHASLGDRSIYVEMNSDLRRALQALADLPPSLSEAIRRSRSEKRALLGVAAFVLLFPVLVLVFAFYQRSSALGWMAHQVPFSVEKKVGDSLYAPRAKPSEATEKVRNKILRLSEDLLGIDLLWKDRISVHFVNDPTVNAFAGLGGHIFLHSGLINKMQGAEELLGVLAHEMAHVKKRHITQSVFQSVGLFALVQAFFGDVTGVVAVLTQVGQPLLQLQYSRELESEADRLAVEYLIRANIQPSGLVQALRMMEAEVSSKMEQLPGGSETWEKLNSIELWSTHPNMQERIAELEQWIQQQQGPAIPLRPTEEWKNLKNAIKTAM